MISFFESASEQDIERFAKRLRNGLMSKFSFNVGQSKMLHLIAEVNGYENWQSLRGRLGCNIPADVADYFLQGSDTIHEDILDVEDKEDVVYLAMRNRNTGYVRATVLYRRADGWFKEVSEGMGPFAEACPTRILDLLSPTDDENTKRWRERCRITSSREGFLFDEDIPYHQLFYVGFPIKAGAVDIIHFARATEKTFEGIDRQGNRAKFTFENLGNTGNINFTAIPEFRNNTWPIEEILDDPFSGKLRLVRIGGDNGVDVLLKPGRRIISWCGYCSDLRNHYRDHGEGGLFDQISEKMRNGEDR